MFPAASAVYLTAPLAAVVLFLCPNISVPEKSHAHPWPLAALPCHVPPPPQRRRASRGRQQRRGAHASPTAVTSVCMQSQTRPATPPTGAPMQVGRWVGRLRVGTAVAQRETEGCDVQRQPPPCPACTVAVSPGTHPDSLPAEAVRLAIDGGTSIVQLREKSADGGPFLQQVSGGPCGGGRTCVLVGVPRGVVILCAFVPKSAALACPNLLLRPHPAPAALVTCTCCHHRLPLAPSCPHPAGRRGSGGLQVTRSAAAHQRQGGCGAGSGR